MLQKGHIINTKKSKLKNSGLHFQNNMYGMQISCLCSLRHFVCLRPSGTWTHPLSWNFNKFRAGKIGAHVISKVRGLGMIWVLSPGTDLGLIVVHSPPLSPATQDWKWQRFQQQILTWWWTKNKNALAVTQEADDSKRDYFAEREENRKMSEEMWIIMARERSQAELGK